MFNHGKVEAFGMAGLATVLVTSTCTNLTIIARNR